MFAIHDVIALLFILQLTHGHMCLEDPVQRGGTEGSEIGGAESCRTGGDGNSPCRALRPECPTEENGDIWIPGKDSRPAL